MIGTTATKTRYGAACASFLVVLLGWTATTVANPLSRSIVMSNESGEKLVVEWVNPKTGKLVTLSQDGVPSGSKVTLDSFVNHTFMVHPPTNETCSTINDDKVGACAGSIITVTEDKEQVAHIKKGLRVDYEDTTVTAPTEASDIVSDCRSQALEYIEEGYDMQDVMDAVAYCMEEQTTALLQQKNEEIAFESQLRTSIANELENHTCAETFRETTEPEEWKRWSYDGTTRDVGILHNRPASQIHLIPNFISPEECQAITDAAAPKLHRGTVADGKGGHQLSDHRKAWQAGVAVPWHKEAEGDLIAKVVRRIYDYTNEAVGYGMEVEGQEDLMSIQYFGKGKESAESPDQYRPHCDGDCDGMPHKNGGRVATMVIYCDTEDLVGGGTNFQHANVFVKPQVGAAAFFSYLDPVTMEKEKGFTTHSGCPVIEGTKRIAVHWMRVGVDAEHPWDSFNTLTIPKDEAEDC